MGKNRPIAVRRRRQRGAVSLSAPSLLIVSALVGALAIDVGRMAWNKRELQAVADLAALDAMRSFGQCAETASDPVVAAQASAAANGYDGDLGTAPNVVEIGDVATVNGIREFTAGGNAATANALRVYATREVPTTLIAGTFLPGSTGLAAEAVATRVAVASIRAGSFAARVNSADSPLLNQVFSGLLGGPVGLDVLSYENLLGADLTVGDLVVAAGVGTVDELLALEFPANQYMNLVATALADRGNTAAAAALNDIAAVTDGSRNVPIAEVLDVAPGSGEPAREAVLNAFDMLDVGAQVAVGDNAIVIDPLAATVPGVSKTTLRMRIIQSPRIAVGPPGRDGDGNWNTQVRTGQVRLAIEVDLLGVLSLLGSQPVSIDLFAEIAPTLAHLDAIDCADADDPVHLVVVGAEPGLVRLGVGSFPDFENSPDPVPSDVVQLNGLFGVPLAKVTAAGDVPFQSSPQAMRFDGPFVPAIPEPSEDNTDTVGTPLGDGVATALAGMLGNTALQVQLLGALPLPVSQATVLNPLSNLLQPVLVALDGPLTSLFEMLGVHLGGADVTVLSLHASQPTLAR
jgi:uncharacterized membrane protein